MCGPRCWVWYTRLWLTLINEVIKIDARLRKLVKVILQWFFWMQSGVAAAVHGEAGGLFTVEVEEGGESPSHRPHRRTHCQEKLRWQQRHSTLTDWNMRWLPTRAASNQISRLCWDRLWEANKERAEQEGLRRMRGTEGISLSWRMVF